MELPKPPWFVPVLAQLLDGRDLEGSLATAMFRDLLGGRVDDALGSDWHVAVRYRNQGSRGFSTNRMALSSSG